MAAWLLDSERLYSQIDGAIAEDYGRIGQLQRQVTELRLRIRQLGLAAVAAPRVGPQQPRSFDRLFAALDRDVHQATRTMRVERGRPNHCRPAQKSRSMPRG